MKLTDAAISLFDAVRSPRDTFDRIVDRVDRSERATVTPIVEWRERLAPLLGTLADTAEETAAIGRALEPLGAFFSDADPEHAELLYTVVRSTRPAVVVETGVSRGVSTRYMLEALERNGHGHLWSIDRITRRRDFKGQAAVAVADRRRWTFIEGTSRRVLPSLLDELGTVDVFVHDSAHTEANMGFEFRAAWPHLPLGGLLVSDDVTDNRAFETFVASVPCDWLVGRQRRGGGFGVAIKRAP
jgi:predicted O-methyltransferase YrrM